MKICNTRNSTKTFLQALGLMIVCLGNVVAYNTLAYSGSHQQYTLSSSLKSRVASETSSRDGWFGPLKLRKSPSPSSGFSEIDEYFAFLDRRYNRLHGEENLSIPVSEWVDEVEKIKVECAKSLSGNNPDVGSDSNRGSMSSLVNLQQYATPIDSNRFKLPTTTLAMVTVAPMFCATTLVATLFNAFLAAVSSHRKQHMKEPSTQVKMVMAFMSSLWKMNTVKAAKAIWRTGGGQKNMAWTLTVMAAVTLLLLRPLLHAVSGEATSAL